MSLSRVFSRAGVGVSAPEVHVEVHIGGGLANLSIVGLPETAVRESRDRVPAALINAGLDFPVARITISLAPADLPKEGGRFDLPIALGILAASGQVPGEKLQTSEFVGELSLSGQLRPVRGILPVALQAAKAGRLLVVPIENQAEAGLVDNGDIRTAGHLQEVVEWLHDQSELSRIGPPDRPRRPELPDLADVVGQHRAKRALEIAAAGNHNLLLIGPPGTGKTMLASRLPGILPPMSQAEALETASVTSISRHGFDPATWSQRPFRAPHHTASAVALVGGGSRPAPGEISLAHNGVLFLDELPEFSRHVLEVLREPMESGRIIISRAASQAEFPARFQFVASMNPCHCGHLGDTAVQCRCSGEQVQRYAHRVSGPLMDRIDLHVEVPRPRTSVLAINRTGEETSAVVAKRVAHARTRQAKRQGCTNALLEPGPIDQHCGLSSNDRKFLETAAEKLALSPRAIHRVLKVARTIADLAGEGTISHDHLAEAMAYRNPIAVRHNA